MKTRQEIKEISKQQFSFNYWISVGATVLAMLIIYVASYALSFLILPIVVVTFRLFLVIDDWYTFL